MPSQLAEDKTYILDGAMGTEIQRRGVVTSLPLWTAEANLTHPEVVADIHRAYLDAGVDIMTTNTFRTTRYTYRKTGNPGRAIIAAGKAVEIAQQTIANCGRNVLLAGSLSTLEDCYRPDLVPENAILEEEHPVQIRLLASLGVDFILAETIQALREGYVIAKACHEQNVPFIMSFITDGKGHLLGGDPLPDAVSAILSFAPLALSLNCRPLQSLTKDLHVLQSCFSGSTCIYANGPGEPDERFGWKLSSNRAHEQYVAGALEWIAFGAHIVGGCCGTTPETIRALRAAVDQSARKHSSSSPG